jgi:hypothetical protein
MVGILWSAPTFEMTPTSFIIKVVVLLWRTIDNLDMDLLLDKDSVRNTNITLLTGQPIYHVSTPSRILHTETTTIKKVQQYESYEMATIEVHTTKGDICRVWGNNIVQKKSFVSLVRAVG